MYLRFHLRYDVETCTIDAHNERSWLVMFDDYDHDIDTLFRTWNQELQNVVDWLGVNKLSLNANKTKYTLFYNKKKIVKNISVMFKVRHFLDSDDFKNIYFANVVI